MASIDNGPKQCPCRLCPRCPRQICNPIQSKGCHHTPNAHFGKCKVKSTIGPLPLASKEMCAIPKIIAYGLSSDRDQLIAVPFENEERYGFFEDNPAIDLMKMRITSDIFHIKGGVYDFEEDIQITIELDKKERRKFEDFFIFARQRGKWSSVTTKYDIKTGILKFSIRLMDTFFAYSQQKVKEINLTQTGASFVADDDRNVRVDFPQDAVDGTRNLSIRVLDIDKGLQETMKSFSKLFPITYMSSCVFVDHDMKDKLQRPATVQVPFIPENIPEDQEFVIFHWGKNKVTIEPATARLGKGLCTLEADEFSGKSTGWARKNGVSDVSFDIQVRMSKGEIKMCKILSFRNPKDRASLYVDCCQLIELEERVSDLKEKGLIEIPHSQSRDLYLNEAEKIKIQLKGSITYVADVPRNYYCITYLSTSSDVHTNLPVKFAKRAGADPHAIVVFETHGARADTLHVVHYDPDRFDGITKLLLPAVPNQNKLPPRPVTEPSYRKNEEGLADKRVHQKKDSKKDTKTTRQQSAMENEEDEIENDEDENQNASDAIPTIVSKSKV